jgi:hypothetical protein
VQYATVHFYVDGPSEPWSAIYRPEAPSPGRFLSRFDWPPARAAFLFRFSERSYETFTMLPSRHRVWTSIGRLQVPQASRVPGLAQALAAQPGQVYRVLLAALRSRAARSIASDSST